MNAFEKFLAIETASKMDELYFYYKELMDGVMEKKIWHSDDDGLKLMRLFKIADGLREARKFVEKNMDSSEVQDMLKNYQEDIFYIATLMRFREEDILCVKNGMLENLMDVIDELSQQFLNVSAQQQKLIEDWEEGNSQIEYAIREESEESIKEKLEQMKK